MNEIFEKLIDTKTAAQAAGDVDAANMIESLIQKLGARTAHSEDGEPFKDVELPAIKPHS